MKNNSIVDDLLEQGYAICAAWQASEGCELMVYLPQQDGTEKVLKIAPLAGRMICFESDKLEHKVHTASRECLSVTGWLLDK